MILFLFFIIANLIKIVVVVNFFSKNLEENNMLSFSQ